MAQASRDRRVNRSASFESKRRTGRAAADEFAYDLDRIASIDVEVRVLWDATHACIALRFGEYHARVADPDASGRCEPNAASGALGASVCPAGAQTNTGCVESGAALE